MSNQVELVSIEKHSKYVLEKVFVDVAVDAHSEGLSVKKKSPTKIEKLYSDPTKIISVIVPLTSESIFETDDEDDFYHDQQKDASQSCAQNHGNDESLNASHHRDNNQPINEKETASTTSNNNDNKNNITNYGNNNQMKSVIKEVIKPIGSSESDFRREGGQFSLLKNEYEIGKNVSPHKYILKPTRFEEYEEGACLLMPYAAFGDAEILSKWQFNNFKNIQIGSMELHKLRCMSQSYEYQQPHIQERIENQCDQLEKYIKEEIISKNLRDSVHVIRTLAKQIGEALYVLHMKHDIAHNDIKPDNIYISEYDAKNNKYNFKLADFGYAKSGNFSTLKESYEFFNRKNKRFFSPELLHLMEELQFDSAMTIDMKKCDIYAFGLALYEILTGGFFPFKDDLNDPMYIKYLKQQLTIKDLMQNFHQYFSQVTDAASMIDLLNHMMDPNPETRYTIIQVLKHPWLKSFKLTPSSKKSSSQSQC